MIERADAREQIRQSVDVLATKLIGMVEAGYPDSPADVKVGAVRRLMLEYARDAIRGIEDPEGYGAESAMAMTQREIEARLATWSMGRAGGLRVA